MRRSLLCPALVLLLALPVLSTVRAQPAQLTDAETDAIDAWLKETIPAGTLAEDAGALLPLYTDDALELFADRPALSGKAALAEFWVSLKAAHALTGFSLGAIHVAGFGSLAAASYQYIAEWRESGAATITQEAGTVFLLLRKQADIPWRIAAEHRVPHGPGLAPPLTSNDMMDMAGLVGGQRWKLSMLYGGVDPIPDLYHEQAVEILPDGTQLIGKAAVMEHWEAFYPDYGLVSITPSGLNMFGTGETTIFVRPFTHTYTYRSAEQQTDTGVWVSLCRKVEDTWVIALNCRVIDD